MFKGETAGVVAAKEKKPDTTPDWAKDPEPPKAAAAAAPKAAAPKKEATPDWAKDANTEPIDLSNHQADATPEVEASAAVPDWATKKAEPVPKAQPAVVRNESAGLIPKQAVRMRINQMHPSSAARPGNALSRR